MDPQTIFNQNLVSLVLNAIGCILLSALILTISTSRRLASRDPVVYNFIFTWILRSALGSSDLLATLAGKQVDGVREETIGLATIVAGFNFSVHFAPDMVYHARCIPPNFTQGDRYTHDCARGDTIPPLSITPTHALHEKHCSVGGLGNHHCVLLSGQRDIKRRPTCRDSCHCCSSSDFWPLLCTKTSMKYYCLHLSFLKHRRV
ncbi:hypothetical protein K439DRAFT_966179 [Ramaria rubella]|nr:hypothetical protein K439DRAFT_966179 [Ramaria rubella]